MRITGMPSCDQIAKMALINEAIKENRHDAVSVEAVLPQWIWRRR